MEGQRYKPEVYQPDYTHDHTKCSTAGCNKPASYLFNDLCITVQGKQKILSFCKEHGTQEVIDEKLHRQGL